MALAIQTLKQPYEINFSGNPILYSFAFTPYGFVEQKLDLKIRFAVQKETGSMSGIFNDIYSDILLPRLDGTASININTIVDSYLSFFTPRFSQLAALRINEQACRFRVTALIQKEGVQFGNTIVLDPINVIKGGMSYEKYHFSGFFSVNILQYKKPLQLFPNESVTRGGIQYLTWLYPADENKQQSLRVKYQLDNGSEYSEDYPLNIGSQKWGMYLTGFSYKQLSGQSAIPQVLASYPLFTMRAFKVSVVNEDDVVIVDEITFLIDTKRSFNETLNKDRYLFYHNSAGGFEWLSVTGEIEIQGEYATSQAQIVSPPSGIRNAILQAQTVAAEISETEKFIGSTDFIPFSKLDLLRDLLLSTSVYESKNLKLIPVNTNKKTLKFYSNRDNLYSMQIEWQHAFANNFFTPPGLFPDNTGICPALDSLDVVQVAKNKLQILWSMAFPYDLVEIEIDNATDTQTLTLNGNSGSQVVSFDNPAVAPDTAPIIIKGRVICDPDRDPPSLGAYSTVNINAFANLAPVANDDEYSLPAGYTTQQLLPGSVMANDYDLDDDPIQVVALVDQPTTAGGTFSIDSAGLVMYTPPSAIFNGIDSFVYTLQEVSDPTSNATATVHIRVGNVAPGTGIFVKIIRRNNVESSSGGTYNNTTIATADFYLAFFSDPVCTIPKDMTGLGINVTVRNTHEKKTNGAVTLTEHVDWVFGGVGTELQVYHGIYYIRHHSLGITLEDSHVFSVLAGAGYIPV